MRTKEVNKGRERFVKDIEVKREVCFTPLAWMPASEGWHEAGMTDFMNYSTKPLVGEAAEMLKASKR